MGLLDWLPVLDGWEWVTYAKGLDAGSTTAQPVSSGSLQLVLVDAPGWLVETEVTTTDADMGLKISLDGQVYQTTPRRANYLGRRGITAEAARLRAYGLATSQPYPRTFSVGYATAGLPFRSTFEVRVETQQATMYLITQLVRYIQITDEAAFAASVRSLFSGTPPTAKPAAAATTGAASAATKQTGRGTTTPIPRPPGAARK